jgi:group I intron endonuclease
VFLYVITNRINGKQYVGITNDVIRRKRFHFSGHGSKLLRHAITKYGRHIFEFKTWYEGDECFIKMMECSIIVALGTRAPHGYNLTWGGDGTRGLHPTAETRKKLSAAHKGQITWMRGRRHTPEARQKMREAWSRKCKAGSSSPSARPVMVDGIVHGCIKDAALATGINVNTLYNRLRRYQKSGCWPVGWGFRTPFDTSLNRKDQINGQD